MADVPPPYSAVAPTSAYPPSQDSKVPVAMPVGPPVHQQQPAYPGQPATYQQQQPGRPVSDTNERRRREIERDEKCYGLLCFGFLCVPCLGVERASAKGRQILDGSLCMCCNCFGF